MRKQENFIVRKTDFLLNSEGVRPACGKTAKETYELRPILHVLHEDPFLKSEKI
jgi:hypothetical protein